MIDITKDLINKRVLIQQVGDYNSKIICNRVKQISPNGQFALLKSSSTLGVDDVGWVRISTYKVLDVLE